MKYVSRDLVLRFELRVAITLLCAIIVDATSRPTGEGHPFGYFPQSFIEQYEYDDIKRMVRDYDPDNELVVVMLKPEDHISTYRVQPYPRPG